MNNNPGPATEFAPAERKPEVVHEQHPLDRLVTVKPAEETLFARAFAKREPLRLAFLNMAGDEIVVELDRQAV